MLVDPARLQRAYYAGKPDIADPNQLVVFGTSGHRGSPFTGAFTNAHIAAITQAICDYRRGQGIDGPLYMRKDTHALPEPTADERAGARQGQLALHGRNAVRRRIRTAARPDDSVGPLARRLR